MVGVVESIFIFVALSESILGVLGNGFIGLVNCADCVKNKKISMIGFILTGLAISRICLIWLIITDGFIKIFSPDMYTYAVIEDFSYLWIIVNQSSIWFATSLSIFYFLKIANFSHHIFLWLKSRINRVLFLLMGFLLISWLLTFPQLAKIINDSRIQTRNRTWHPGMHKSQFFLDQALLNLGVLFLFTLSLITSFLLLISLWRHYRQMQSNVSGFRDASTEAHLKAMKVLMSFIILFILYFMGIVIEISYYLVPENKLLFIFGVTITIIYPWGHSFILILGNSKLKQVPLKVLNQLKCHEKGNNPRLGVK
ncbi:taste receptor type 2 member 10-like [Dasypus novemcinctus]|uniref:taste receptor type 2 member 10-like n=1 Tax=Dasypus novemcinctus TaxID=9361 RepID=UPI000328DBE9|nr:taste receptor type 2 member 10-like [Dasypus novemcinctus]